MAKQGTGKESQRLRKVESAYNLSKQYSQLMEESNQRLDEKVLELTLLNDASRLFSASLDPRNVSAQVYNLINKKLNVDASCLFLLQEEEGAEITITSNLTVDENLVNNVKDKLADLVFLECRRRMQKESVPVITCHGENFKAALPVLGQFASFYSASLTVGGRQFGYFCLINRVPDTFRKEDVKFFTTLSNQMAMFIESDCIKNRIIAGNIELRRRTEELDKANQELYRSNKELDDFTCAVSHDLKEPLRGIEAFSMFLQEGYGEVLDERGRHYIDVIISSVLKLKNLIDDLLKLSRITRLREQYEEVNLNELLEDIREELQYTIQEKNARVDVLPLPTVRYEKAKLELVFSNLVANALKYNDKEEPTIEIGGGEDGPGEYRFYVKDNGKGIEEQYFEKIFEIFQRLEHLEDGGTGAGLTIVKRIVESYGGRVWLESKVGKGCTFYFTLPRAVKE